MLRMGAQLPPPPSYGSLTDGHDGVGTRCCLSCLQKKAFAEAIEYEYYFEMFIDDLPMYGYIGEVSEWAVASLVVGLG